MSRIDKFVATAAADPSDGENSDVAVEEQKRVVMGKQERGSKRGPKPGKDSNGVIQLPRLDIRIMKMNIVGDSPLICHRKSEEKMNAIIDKQTGVPSAGRKPRDLNEEFEQSLYKLDGGGLGFPACAFKQAAVSACTSLKDCKIPMTLARQSHHVMGQFVKLTGKPVSHIEMVRPKRGGGLMPCARGRFDEWSCVLQIRYNARVLSDAELINLFNLAGFGVGVGDGRPEKLGGRSYGMFHVE